MKKKEIVLQDTSLENVILYIYDKLQDMEKASFQDRNIHYHSFYAYFYGNKVEVECLASVSNQIRWPVISFEAHPLQTNTVRLKAKCHLMFLESIFDSYWDNILKDFGIVQSNEKDISNSKEDPEISGARTSPALTIEYWNDLAQKRGKSGRHSYPEDIWAHEQIYMLDRPKDEVRQEWLAMMKKSGRNLLIPGDQWKVITKPEWRRGKIRKNI